MALDPSLTIQQHDNVLLSELLAAAQDRAVTFTHVDLIAANAEVYAYVHRGVDALVTWIDTRLTAALATGDATITAEIDGAAVTGGVVTITQAASAPGDIDNAQPTALNTITSGQVLTLTVGGANTAAVFADVSVALGSTL